MKLRPITHSLRLTLFATFAFSALALAENKLPEITVDAAPMARTHENSFAPIVEKVSPSVVTISISKNVRIGGRNQGGSNPLMDDPFFRKFFGIPDDEPSSPRGNGKDSGAGRKRVMPVGLGSGVIVSKDGYIITNNHVVDQADEITVTLADGKTELKATKIGSDAGSDIAVIKVDAKDLKPITFTDSDKIKVGDIALAIGNPFALRQTVTKGIISAVGRNQTGMSEFGNFIQTDASINPGNSGGALVDALGRLVGINSAIFSQSGGSMGIGFAVPSNQARSVMESLIKFGKVQRGFLGIQMQPLDEKLAKEFKAPDKDGILVAEVVPGGGAEKAGVKSGDIIVKLNGQRPDDIAALRNSVANMMPGTKVELEIYRNGKPQNISVTLVERPSAGVALGTPGAPAPAPVKVPDVLDGVTVTDLNAELRKRFAIGDDVKGALITQVNPDSACADADVRAGDIIVDIDGKRVATSDDAVKLSEEVKTKSSVRLRINRKGQTQFVVVEERKE
ncbi:MAG: DegQ family serine endoprotease [Verrucomicrobia bacterium]|nr:DegQ family serine endoprotease [Verrucomicrobiota bacterium]